MKIYEVEERTPLVAPLLNIWEEIWYSKLWNPGSYSQLAESAGSWIMNIWILKHINEPILLRVDGFRITARNNGKSV